MLKFQEADKEDYEEICKLIENKEELFRVYPGGKYPFTVEQIAAFSELRKELTVAEIDNEITGFANLYDYESGKFSFIGNVMIKKNQRGNGLGKQIIEYMLNISCEKHKLPEIRISVFSENTPAMLLYSSPGFEPYAIEERKDYNNKRVALVHMKMKL